MQQIAMRWLVYRLTRSELMLGLVAFVSDAPLFLLVPFAGVLADRLGFLARQRDVLVDNLHRAFRNRALFLHFERSQDGFVDIVWDFRGSAPNQFKKRIQQDIHRLKC